MTPKSPRRTTFATIAVLGIALLTTACGSDGGTASADADNTTTNADCPASSHDWKVKGKTFKVLATGAPEASKIVTHHAMEVLKCWGAKASLEFSPAQTNIAISQVQSGDFQAYSGAVPPGLGAIAAGSPLVDFALAQPRQDYVVIAKPNVKSVADLKGKKMGILDYTINYAQALIVLKSGGIGPKDVTFIASGGQSARLAALISGRLDATMLSHTSAVALDGKGYNVIYDFTKQNAELYDDNFFALKSWLDKNKDLATAINAAFLYSFDWFNDPANAEDAVKEAGDFIQGLNVADTRTLFELLRENNAYPAKSILVEKALSEQQDVYVQVKVVKKPIPLSQWVDTSYAEEALQTYTANPK